MKKSVIIILCIIGNLLCASIYLSSCSKENDQLQTPPSWSGKSSQTTGYSGSVNVAHRGESRPIVIMRPVRPNGVALASTIVLVNAPDTLIGFTTLNNPNCTFQLPTSGGWLVSITSKGYIPISETRNYADSFVYQVDTLKPVQ